MQLLFVKSVLSYASRSYGKLSAMTTRKLPRARKGADSTLGEAALSASTRHGEIARKLPSYTTYKRWSDQMKAGWAPLEDPSR